MTTVHIDSGHLMTVRVEVWALAADQAGIWLINGGGDAWRSRPLVKDTDPHWAVERILRKHGALGSSKLIHSSSWRAEGESVIATYFAIVDCPAIRSHWPGAHLVSPLLPEVWGKPYTHAADQPPTPRRSDVLMHSIGHIKRLTETNSTAAAALPPAWGPHLEAFAETLAGMYSEVHGAA